MLLILFALSIWGNTVQLLLILLLMANNVTTSEELKYLLELLINSSTKSDKRKHLHRIISIYAETIAKLSEENKTLKDALRSSAASTAQSSDLSSTLQQCTSYNDMPQHLRIYIAFEYVRPIANVCVIIAEWKSVHKFKVLPTNESLFDIAVILEAVSKLPAFVAIREVYVASERVRNLYNDNRMLLLVGAEYVMIRQLREKLAAVPIFILSNDDMGRRTVKYLSRLSLEDEDEKLGWSLQIIE